MKACGFNKDASKYAGINENRSIVCSMLIAGAIAGLAGGIMYLSGTGKHIEVVDIIPAEKPVTNKYPNVTVEVQGKQFKLNWTPVDGAEMYGIAVYSAGKWKVMDYIQGNTTTYTSKKILAGTYKTVLVAKVNGEWDLSKINSRAFEITIK